MLKRLIKWVFLKRYSLFEAVGLCSIVMLVRLESAWYWLLLLPLVIVQVLIDVIFNINKEEGK